MVLEGKTVENEYLRELLTLRERIKKRPVLKVITDESEDSRAYERSIKRVAKNLDVEIVYDGDADGVINLGKESVDILPDLDIEGISPYHLGLLSYGKPKFLPPTPYAAIKILEFYGFEVEGKVCTIIGRSVRVGKPLAMLILLKNGTPIITHTKTPDVKEFTRLSDYVFLSAGIGEYFGREYFTENSIVVDISTVFKGGKLVGDAKFDELKDYVKAITPVPGGVGRITTLVLFENLFKKLLEESLP
ncbi:MAG: bifunctional 5,10-methylenetetrahydrofolate dehydrogenase/5,10-methenyltetrahydrofolate cyclohydrolase [candidate division WOR-3 bacterium]